MTARADPGDNDFVQVDISDDIATAVILEAQVRSQGIQVARMDHGVEGRPSDGCMQRLLVRRRDLPSSSKCSKSYRADINLECL